MHIQKMGQKLNGEDNPPGKQFTFNVVIFFLNEDGLIF